MFANDRIWPRAAIDDKAEFDRVELFASKLSFAVLV